MKKQGVNRTGLGGVPDSFSVSAKVQHMDASSDIWVVIKRLISCCMAGIWGVTSSFIALNDPFGLSAPFGTFELPETHVLSYQWLTTYV